MRSGFHPDSAALGPRRRVHRQLRPTSRSALAPLAVVATVVMLCVAGIGGPFTALSVLLFGSLLIGAGVAGRAYLSVVAGPTGRHWIAIHDGGLAIRSVRGEPLVLPWSRVRLEERQATADTPAEPRLLVQSDAGEAGENRRVPDSDPRTVEIRLDAYTGRRRLLAALRSGHPVPPPHLPRPAVAVAAAAVVGFLALAFAPQPGWLRPVTVTPLEAADSTRDLATVCRGTAYPGSPPVTPAGPYPHPTSFVTKVDWGWSSHHSDPLMEELRDRWPPGEPADVTLVGCMDENLERLKVCGPYYATGPRTGRTSDDPTFMVAYQVEYVVTFRQVATGEPLGEVVVVPADTDYTCPDSIRTSVQDTESPTERVEPTSEEVIQALTPMLDGPASD